MSDLLRYSYLHFRHDIDMIYTIDIKISEIKFFLSFAFLCWNSVQDKDVCQHAFEGTIVLVILFFRVNWSKSQEWSYFLLHINIYILKEMSASW